MDSKDELKGRCSSLMGQRRQGGGTTKKNTDFTQPGSSLTIFPASQKLFNTRKDWYLRQLLDPCPKCGHTMLIAEESQQSIQAKISHINVEHKFAMLLCLGNGAKKETKPPTSQQQQQGSPQMCF